MLKIRLFAFFIIQTIFIAVIFAQQNTQDIFKEIEKRSKKLKKPKQIKDGFNPQFSTGILLTQSSYNNWQRGGENSLAWTLNNDGSLLYKKHTFEWITGLKTAFGQTRVGSQEFRKTEDRLEFESLCSKQIKKYLSPFVSFFLQTQFAPGYKYNFDSSNNQEIKTQISGFWDPAHLLQSIGSRLQPFPGMNVRLGFAAKEILTRKFKEYSGGKWYSIEAGMEVVANFNREILPKTHLKSDLRLFSAFERFQVIQMTWESHLSLKFNKFFSANIRLFIYYEPDITEKIQIKEIMGVGFSYSFFE